MIKLYFVVTNTDCFSKSFNSFEMRFRIVNDQLKKAVLDDIEKRYTISNFYSIIIDDGLCVKFKVNKKKEVIGGILIEVEYINKTRIKKNKITNEQ